MPPSLLDSQLATLELPAADEDALTLDGSALQSDLCADALSWLRVGGNA
jgi:gluconokinase